MEKSQDMGWLRASKVFKVLLTTLCRRAANVNKKAKNIFKSQGWFVSPTFPQVLEQIINKSLTHKAIKRTLIW